MSKRPGSPLSGPPPKKRIAASAVINIGVVAGQEDLETKTLAVQNKMLAEKVRIQNSHDEALRGRISQLEDQIEVLERAFSSLLSYWGRLEEQVQTMLGQSGAVCSLGKQPDCASMPAQALIEQLTSIGEGNPIHEELKARCEFTVASTRELTVTLDRLYQRVSEECIDVDLGKENERLHELVTSLRGQVCETGGLRDKLSRLKQRVESLTGQAEEKDYDLDRARSQVEKLKIRLEEAHQNVQPTSQQQASGQQQAPQSSSSASSLQPQIKSETHSPAAASPAVDVTSQEELKEQRELATTRLKEIDMLQEKLQQVLRDLELAKSAAHQVSDFAIQNSPLFLSLQSQYSTLFQERQQLKGQLDESVQQLKECKEQYMGHLDKVEADEIKYHRMVQEDITRLSEKLAESQREVQMLRIENEQTRVASEQMSTSKELRRFAGGLQKENKQLKAELTRCKQSVEEGQTMLERLRDGASLASLEVRAIEKRVTEKPKDTDSTESKDAETLREELKKLKEDIKKAQDAEKESRMLLDAYKGVSKEQREKAEIMGSEAKCKIELEEAKKTLEAQSDRLMRDCLNDSEASQRWKEAQDTIQQLHHALSSSQRNYNALLSEMDVTGEAFEEMQEQNTRLLSQLQEKDDANFKLMSERINANTLHSLQREEKQVLESHAQMIKSQLTAQSELIQRLHEKERLLQLDLTGREEEITRRVAHTESLKRKALECAQSAQDRKIQAEKSSAEVKELRQRLADHQAAVEQEQHQVRRLKEEIASVQQQADRSKQSSFLATADEILQEEVKIYKTKLTCPCCNTNKKDCILIKCYHVFCFDCVQKRYDTRQRKCPKCNAAFGANDFHRVYL